MSEEEIEQCIEDLLTVACCPGHDESCEKVYHYIKHLQEENERLKTILEVILKRHLEEFDIEMLYKTSLELKELQSDEWK